MQIGVGVYVVDSVSAVKLYSEAFGLTLGYHVLNADGTYFHSELSRCGEPFLSVVESRDGKPAGNAAQLGVTMPDKASLERAFELLSVGADVSMPICELPWSPCAFSLTDSFGVWWFVSLPQHRPEGDELK
ncbi:MAG: hypothetical protein PHI27_10445 [Eubacteriales bacterium]|nr:hypothetical protein [Eubacteriales bacterium]MDD3882659.1 hypothetical protein [Eubacteriales bacterium]MDD4512769.1 hypothetical protein [Eubacteriales bacterium]